LVALAEGSLFYKQNLGLLKWNCFYQKRTPSSWLKDSSSSFLFAFFHNQPSQTLWVVVESAILVGLKYEKLSTLLHTPTYFLE